MAELPKWTAAQELEVQQQSVAEQHRLNNTLVLTRLYPPPIRLECSDLECKEPIEQDVSLTDTTGDVYHPYCFILSDPSHDDERTRWLINLLSHVLRNAPMVGDKVNPLAAQALLVGITPYLTRWNLT